MRKFTGVRKEKFCAQCDQTKRASEFYSNKSQCDGLASHCKECAKRIQRLLYANNPERQRQRTANYIARYRAKYNASRRANRSEIYISECSRKYKASKEVIRELIAREKCDICGSNYRLSIDHCHKLNRVRGLLCDHCNNLLGRARDDISILSHAIKYLRKCTTS